MATDDDRTITLTITYTIEWGYENFCVSLEDVLGEEHYAKLTEADRRKMWETCLEKNPKKVEIEIDEDDLDRDTMRSKVFPVMDEMAKEFHYCHEKKQEETNAFRDTK
jgi:hypothetical protein